MNVLLVTLLIAMILFGSAAIVFLIKYLILVNENLALRQELNDEKRRKLLFVPSQNEPAQTETGQTAPAT